MHRFLPRLALLGAALPLLLATCRDDPVGPGRGGAASLAIQPVVSSAVDLAAFGLTADTIRLVVIRRPADTLRALTVFFDPDSSQIRLAADVVLRAAVETLTVHLELRGGGFALFSGTRALEVRAGRPGAPQQIPVTYTGPGSTVAALTLTPRDTVLSFGDSFRFRVSARDSSGAPVTLFYVAWSSSDTTGLRVNATGLARAPSARAALTLRARAPSGAADSTPVTVIPVPTLLSVVSGAGQTGVVGGALPLPFRVRVTAADGLGVKGIPVRFRALGGGGGGVADSLVVSDTGGYAATVGTLGTIAGSQSFEASALALPATSVSATALAGAVATATSIVTASATSVLSGAIATLTLRAKDAFGNSLTTGGRAVAFTVTGGTSTGVIGPTTDHGDGTYTATFTGLLAGSAVTIGATIDGSPVTSPLPTLAVLAGAVTQVVVTPASAALDALGLTQRFSATARDANGNVVSGQAFTWTSDNPLVALVDPSGVVTAVANGTATIRAAAGGVSGSGTLAVAQIVRSVVVSPASAALANVNLLQQYGAVALDGNGRPVAGQTFTWSSSDPAIATVDATGLATGLTPGSVTITATAAGVAGTATLSVAQVVTSVAVTPASATLDALGLAQQFSAIAKDANGAVILGRSFTWSASPAGVATIDPVTGLATALANGVTTITATTGGVSGTATLSVAQIVKSVVVSPASATLDALGLTQQFSAAAQDANGNVVPGQSFTWSASPAGVVAIDPVTGLATAVANGVATISATTAGVSGTATLSVAQAVGSVVVSPATATLDALGLTQQFTAVAKDANGAPIVGQTFAWTSSVPGVAAVEPSTGLVTAIGNGVATVTATAGGLAGAASLTVAQVATQLGYVTQPSNGLAGDTLAPAVQVAALDRTGHTVAAFAGDISLQLGATPAPAALLHGVTNAAAVGGVATFPDVNVDSAGSGYTLVAASANLVPATSAPFAVGGVIAAVPVGQGPLAVGVNAATSRVYVADNGAGAVTVVDGGKLTNIATLTGVELPFGVGVNESTNHIYVSSAGTATVFVIDGATNSVVPIPAVGTNPKGVAVDQGTNRIYTVADVGTLVPLYALVPIDGGTNVVVTTGIVTLPDAGTGVAFNPNDGRVYVTMEAQNAVAVVDPAAATLIATIPVGLGPYGIAADPGADLLYVSNQAAGSVSVVDPKAGREVAQIAVGRSPQGLGVDRASGRVYVANSGEGTISIIDGAKRVVVATLAVGPTPTAAGVDATTGRAFVPVSGQSALKVIRP